MQKTGEIAGHPDGCLSITSNNNNKKSERDPLICTLAVGFVDIHLTHLIMFPLQWWTEIYAHWCQAKVGLLKKGKEERAG